MKKKIIRKKKSTTTSEMHDFYKNLEFSVILVETEGSANVGSIARLMKNFEFKNLILFNPQCEIDSDARKYSMHARLDILNNARIIKLDENISKTQFLAEFKKLLDEFNYVIATSGKSSFYRNITRVSTYIDELDLSNILGANTTADVNYDNKQKIKIAIVFGREPSGLKNEELELCDFLVKIPASDSYSTLNLSHAAAIVFFTIFKKTHSISKGTILASTKKQREILLDKLKVTLEIISLPKEIDDKIIQSFKNIIGRSFTSMKEINLLITLFDQIIKHNRFKSEP
ncbi:MAG: RNA methyltransferase [Promethearchaeota archaeon]